MPLGASHSPGDTITAADINAIETAVNALSAYTDEQVRDVIGAALVAGSNVTITPNDGADTITIAASGGGSSGLLAVTSYRPSAGQVTTTSTSFVDVDATNLVITFTAPASGAVLVTLNALGRGTGGDDLYWNLRDGSGDISGTDMLAITGSTRMRFSGLCRVTGLTPGNSYTWKWGFCTNNAASTAYFFRGGVYGPATMTVEAA